MVDEQGVRVVRDGSMLGMSRRYLSNLFVPEGVTEDYYNYVWWKAFQRFVSATVNVFGVQAMLLALGIKTRGALGMAAATSWVLKDALGKFGRIAWAGKMGRQFDADSKRWRFRSSLFFAAGNGLEIITYVFPANFLALATGANLLKQVSMLTSSATRNAIYRSFAANNNNIGEISAKGEAQIAVVDLLGMLSGISLSRAVGTSQLAIGCAYLLLSSVDLFAIYREIRAVVFRDLNFERLSVVFDDLTRAKAMVAATPAASMPCANWPAAGETQSAASASSDGCGGSGAPAPGCLEALRPSTVAVRERVFRDPRLGRDQVFRALHQLKPGCAGPALVRRSILNAGTRKYALLLAQAGSSGGGSSRSDKKPIVLLHSEARNGDRAHALLAYFKLLRILEREDAAAGAAEAEAGSGDASAVRGSAPSPSSPPAEPSSLDDDLESLRLAAEAVAEADADMPEMVAALRRAGWNTERFMLPVTKRLEWDIPAAHPPTQPPA